MTEKSQNADSGEEIKGKNKKEKTTQQQKCLPTLSADLNKDRNNNIAYGSYFKFYKFLKICIYLSW